MALTKLDRESRLRLSFTPYAPVTRKDAFAGRLDQVFAVTSALGDAGKHVALYGERGVGKTSLATVLVKVVGPALEEFWTTARVNCATNDSYKSIWTKVIRELNLEVPEEWASYGSQPDPDDIRRILRALDPPAIIILDEFDRIEDDDSLSLMADTIKSLSDHVVPSKLVIVGVADSIDQLIGEHQSIQRAIQEVPLPRMSQDDLTSIIDNGMAFPELSMQRAARQRISALAEGLPHYVHLLALEASMRAVKDDRTVVTNADVDAAIRVAVDRHSLAREFQTAIQSPRRDTLFAQVLVACALAEKNRLGYFTTGAVREPMSRIMGRPYEIQGFASHLAKFLEPARGSVLRREGVERNYTYRFQNPLLQPFAVLTALAEGMLPRDYREELFGSEAAD